MIEAQKYGLRTLQQLLLFGKHGQKTGSRLYKLHLNNKADSYAQM